MYVVQFFHLDIGNKRGLCSEPFSAQRESERLPHRAVSAIAANKVFRGHHLSGGQMDAYAAVVRRHPLECRAELDLTA
jgi:hypothetical protein